MTRISNATINVTLTSLRNDIRVGKVKVVDGDLQSVIRAYLFAPKIEDKSFSRSNFNPQTVERFVTLFRVPNFNNKWPTQDNYAWALQNFMNRRFDPWAFIFKKTPIAPVLTQASI